MTDKGENEPKKRRRTADQDVENEEIAASEAVNEIDENEDEGAEEENATPVINPEDELDEIYNRSSGELEEGEAASSEASTARAPAGRTRSRGAVNSARQLILEDVQERVQIANERLRANLLGSLLIEVSDKKERYLLDWKEPVARVTQLDKDNNPGADCSLKISERDLLRIANGELNPQVAMLSDKVQGQGKLGLAVYFFNLVVQGYE